MINISFSGSGAEVCAELEELRKYFSNLSPGPSIQYHLDSPKYEIGDPALDPALVPPRPDLIKEAPSPYDPSQTPPMRSDLQKRPRPIRPVPAPNTPTPPNERILDDTDIHAGEREANRSETSSAQAEATKAEASKSLEEPKSLQELATMPLPTPGDVAPVPQKKRGRPKGSRLVDGKMVTPQQDFQAAAPLPANKPKIEKTVDAPKPPLDSNEVFSAAPIPPEKKEEAQRAIHGTPPPPPLPNTKDVINDPSVEALQADPARRSTIDRMNQPGIHPKNAKEAIQLVNKNVGFETAREILSEFGYDSVLEVPENKFPPLIEACVARVKAHRVATQGPNGQMGHAIPVTSTAAAAAANNSSNVFDS